MGFVISQELVKMDPKKVRAIVEYTNTRSTSKVKGFHGLTISYTKFVRYLNGVCAPFIECMKKGSFEWNVATNISFKLLKRKVIEQLVLALLYFSKGF
jgi:hypothetical protein